MNVSVTIAQHLRRWRLIEAGAVTDWLESAPWHNARDPLVLHVGRATDGPVEQALLDEARRWATHEVGVVEVEGRSDVFTTLGAWLGIATTDWRRVAEGIATASAHLPRLLIVSLPDRAAAQTWREDCQNVLDTANKVPRGATCGILLLDRSATPPPLAVRALIGWPATDGASESDIWASYVHERVAWHAAGDLNFARRIDEFLPFATVGNDAAVEQALTAHARDAFTALDTTLRIELSKSLQRLRALPHLCLPRGLPGHDARAVRAAPWLARALLHHFPDHPDRRSLSTLEVCRPLADRLLGRCQYLEQRCRDAILRQLPGHSPPEEAQLRYETFRRGQGDEHDFAPTYPHRARDAWDFSHFGDVLKSTPSNEKFDKMHELRRLRNLLAHGRPIGWKATERLNMLERALA